MKEKLRGTGGAGKTSVSLKWKQKRDEWRERERERERVREKNEDVGGTHWKYSTTLCNIKCIVCVCVCMYVRTSVCEGQKSRMHKQGQAKSRHQAEI